MANKKLKVELELETAKAKQQLGHMADGVGTASPGVSTRSTDKLAEATSLNTKQMISMTRAFSGMALGLAASYSSRYFAQGSTAEKALTYGGAAISGASMGSMMGAPAGPWGMAAGAVVGAGVSVAKEYLDTEAKRKKALKDFDEMEHRIASLKELSEYIKDITSKYGSFHEYSYDDKLEHLADNYEATESVIKLIVDEIRASINNGEDDNVKLLTEELNFQRHKSDTLLSASADIVKNRFNAYRPRATADDRLSQIGGGFGLPTRKSEFVETVYMGNVARLLEDIKKNTGRTATWL